MIGWSETRMDRRERPIRSRRPAGLERNGNVRGWGDTDIVPHRFMNCSYRETAVQTPLDRFATRRPDARQKPGMFVRVCALLSSTVHVA